MGTKTLAGASALLVAAVALGGCATHTTPNTFSARSRSRQRVDAAWSKTARAVTIQNDSRGVATATGAVLGGIAGSMIGGSSRGQRGRCRWPARSAAARLATHYLVPLVRVLK